MRSLTAPPPPVRAVADILAELGELKRVRAAGRPGSVACEGFRRAWAALLAGDAAEAVAAREAACALASARLGAIDRAVLRACGLDEDAAAGVLERAFDAVAAPLPDALRDALRPALAVELPPPPAGSTPWWVEALAEQPRAGATRPGHARLVLSPAESHAEHCWVVAIGGVLLGGGAEAFLCGLSHHLHNATLPDSGFAGEVLLGEHLEAVIAGTTELALDELALSPRTAVERARGLLDAADSAEARAFHAADVLDRVLEQRHHALAAAFTLDQALEELELVHAGPLQAFGVEVLREAGLA